MLTQKPVTGTIEGHRRAICGGCFVGWKISQVSGKRALFGVREVKGE